MKKKFTRTVGIFLACFMLAGVIYGIVSAKHVLPENPVKAASPMELMDGDGHGHGLNNHDETAPPTEPTPTPPVEPTPTPPIEPTPTPSAEPTSSEPTPSADHTPSQSPIHQTQRPNLPETPAPSETHNPIAEPSESPVLTPEHPGIPGDGTPAPSGDPGFTLEPTAAPGDGTPEPSGDPGFTLEPTDGPGNETPAPSGDPGHNEPYIATDLYSGIYTPKEITGDILKFFAYPAGGDNLSLKVYIKESNEDTNNGLLLTPDETNHFYSELELNHEYIVTMYLYQDGSLYGNALRFYITYRRSLANADDPEVGEHPPTITTNRDGDDSVITSSHFLFRVSARDWQGEIIYSNHITVTLDGVVQTNPTGSSSFEYALMLTPPVTGSDIEHIVTVLAWDDEGNSAFRRIVLRYHYVPNGEANGRVTVRVDATTLGLGILAEETLTVHEGDTAAELLLALLEEYGYEADYSGTPKLNFYLRRILGGDIAYYASIPDNLWELIMRDGISLTDQHDRDSIGEFDYTRGSGWMCSINGIYPGIGLSEYYPIDGDVLALRFTLAFGKDIGGYDASSPGEGMLSGYCGLWIDDEFIPLTHDYVEVDRMEPTESEEGYIDYRCAKCHHEYREILPPSRCELCSVYCGALKIKPIHSAFVKKGRDEFVMKHYALKRDWKAMFIHSGNRN